MSEVDYKTTLNLPKTDFPMKGNLPNKEPERLARWNEMGIYQQVRSARQGCERFVLHDGPPYANGSLHVGHVLNKVIKDIVNKSKTLSGYDTPYVPGWDCHGLPIEVNVEKKKGKAGDKISASDFRRACREYAESQMDGQRESFKRLGVLGDWENPYLTMDFQFEADIVRSLARIYHNGYLERGEKPVYWCVACGSALAEAEVEYTDKRSPAVDILFDAVDQDSLLNLFSVNDSQGLTVSIPIWTTTPWTLPANQAIAVHPEVHYALVKIDRHLIVIAEPLLASAMDRYKKPHYELLGHCQGQALEGLKLKHPFLNREVPVILGNHVTVDTGTGAVHTAPAHGPEDFDVARYYQLPIENPVGDNGRFIQGTEYFEGQEVFQSNGAVIELIQERGKLLSHAELQHSYPHCWRHKTPLIFRTTAQWFIRMDNHGLRDQALEAIKSVHWIPGQGQNRLSSMIENRPDWCISRQRTWGVPITLLIHQETGEPHPKSGELFENIAKSIEKRGVEAWFDMDIASLIGDDAREYRKVTDIVDVWFESGVTNACVLERREDLTFPADLYLEGSDQHRGWFQSSLLASLARVGKAPYRSVLTHGFTVDAQGRKMSKSLGNVVDPGKVLKTYGADIMRLWVASGDYRAELSISDEILKRTADNYRRLRNTARFLLANLHDFDPAKHLLPADQMLPLDTFAVEKAYHLQNEIIEHYNSYQFHLIAQKLHHFCSIDMGGFYLDIIKDRQYTMQSDSIGRRSAQTAIYHILHALVRWLTPILSFTADEIWEFIPGDVEASTLFTQTWYEGLFKLSDPKITFDQWQQLMTVRNCVNKEIEEQRRADKIGAALEAQVICYCDDKLLTLLNIVGDELRFLLITSDAVIKSISERSTDAVSTELPDFALVVKRSGHEKCSRCWHHCADVGSDGSHPTLCSRCVSNVDGEGEKRSFV